jgi:predicted NodU family carbamoyl transferase
VDPEEILAMADERFERRLTEESAWIRQEITALRAEMATRAEMNAILQSMATREEMTTLRQEMSAGFSRLEHELANSRVEMIKWSFMFCTGQCLAILGFLFVFLRNR